MTFVNSNSDKPDFYIIAVFKDNIAFIKLEKNVLVEVLSVIFIFQPDKALTENIVTSEALSNDKTSIITAKSEISATMESEDETSFTYSVAESTQVIQNTKKSSEASETDSTENKSPDSPDFFICCNNILL